MSKLESLPAALFGGDLYYQMGCVRGIRASLDPMVSCSTSDALPGYLPLYGTLVALLSLLARLDVLRSMLVAAVLLKALSVFVVFLAVGRIFDRSTGLIVASLWLFAHPALIARYTEFTAEIVAPLYFLALCVFLRDRSARHAVFLGVMLAICGYSHAVAFVSGVLIFVIASLLGLAWTRSERPWGQRLAAYAGHLMIVAMLSLLTLGYWWKPIFHYHGRTSAHYTEWNGGPTLAGLSDRIDYAWSTMGALVRFDSFAHATVNALVVLGLVALFRASEDRNTARAVALATGATLLFSFHYFVTEPLFRINFIPDYVLSLMWGSARFLLVAGAVSMTVAWLRRRRAPVTVEPALLWGSVLMAGISFALAPRGEDERIGGKPLHPLFSSLQTFVEQHTRPDDVFLSCNELSFALSALTGRKVMVTRRAQNDAFIDMDVRNKDAALILYGSDPELRVRLIRQYGIRYLLWTDEWPSTEFYLDERGRVMDYDDPLLYFQDAGYDRELERADVHFVHRLGWVDPTLRGNAYKRFPLTIVTPDNYARPDRPWHPDFDALTERVWSYEENGRAVAAIYRVRL